jgi:hypothetical protein
LSSTRSNRVSPGLLKVALLIALASCSGFLKKKTERILARVDKEYLYESDIRGILPAGTTPTDSMTLVRGFIDNWIRHKLLIQQAQKNLSPGQMDFTSQLEEYKNSLIIYAYENALVQQKLDTVVTGDEIESYYNSNQGNFLLKDNIVQVQYVKLPKASRQVTQFRTLLNSDTPDSRNKLSQLCEKQAVDYFLDDQNWISFTEVLKEVPLKTYNQEEFLKNNRSFEYQDSAFVYLIRIRDFKIKESVSPMDFERERIRSVILNKRKIDLINRMHQDVYDNALKHDEFEIY